MNKRKSITENTPETILKSWAEDHDLTVAELGRALGYTSNHLQLVLGPSRARPVNFDLLGRLAYTFEADNPVAEMVAAMKQG